MPAKSVNRYYPKVPKPIAAEQTLISALEVRGFLFNLSSINNRLSLSAPHLGGYGAMCIDWEDADLKRRIQGGKKQLLAKAIGFGKNPHPQVLDCTGGLGRDAFTLASLGAQVQLLERAAPLVQLLEDAHQRALHSANTSIQIAAQNIQITAASAHDYLADICAQNVKPWEVIYLDPMYPEDGKTALPSKEMQILRDLTGGDSDADALLELALGCVKNRVVVKRPAKAPWLAHTKPALEFKGTQARFDVYFPALNM